MKSSAPILRAHSSSISSSLDVSKIPSLQAWRTSPQTACDLSVKSGRDSRKLPHSLPSHEMEPAKKIRESQELCHGSPEKFSQGVSTELVRPFFQNFKIPNWLSICLSVFHSITTSQTQRSVKYGQDRGEGPPFQRGTAALDPAGVALTLARSRGREASRARRWRVT
jgi:hypothetical protein